MNNQKKYLPVTERLENNHPIARKIKTSKEYKTYPKRYYEPEMRETPKVKYCNVCCNGTYVYEQVFCETCFEIARLKEEKE